MIGIVAHTARTNQAKTLAHTVKADFISIDTGFLGCDDNHTTVQHHLAGLHTVWSVILEDDAAPVNDFCGQLAQALSVAPTPIVSLYLGRRRPPHWQQRIRKAALRAENENASWIVGTHLLHAVGYAIKTELLPSLLNFDSDLPVDQHITRWAQTTHGHPISYTWPSLVNHLDLPTLVEHPDGKPRHPGRTAWATGTRDQWTTHAVPLT